MLILGKKTRLALASQALAASLLIALGAANPLPARAQGGLPTLGDGSDLTSSEERRLGDRIIRELYRDPDYIDDPVIGEYVQGIWQPLMAAARALDKSDPAFLESVQRAMQGDFASFYPQRWIAYEQRSEEVRQLLYPLAALENRPGMAALRELIENKTGLSPAQQDAQLGYLPLVQGATLDWVAVLNKTTALPVAYGHVDGW